MAEQTFACPNQPRCPHPSFVHDIHDLDDERPMCCVEGCDCGSEATDDRG